jgi:hypothetical protein
MGMFDIVLVRCPWPDCGHVTENQSKADRCELRTYRVDDAPLSIIADLAESGLNACEQCGRRPVLRVQCGVRVDAVEVACG